MDRDEFMNLVYDELHSDGDNNRANRIIDAADEYVESALLGTNLAEVSTDTISRQAAIDALCDMPCKHDDDGYALLYRCDATDRINGLPSAHPDNQVHLCDSCSYTYPECPSVYTDVIFGNGIGNDNICACSKYLPSAQPEIIYCKDCARYDGKGHCERDVRDILGYGREWNEDDYCSDGIRRETDG